MGLGSTAKKIQGISDKAEQMYKQVQELQSRIIHLEEEVDDTHDTVKTLDVEMAEQRALLEAIADEQGLDVDAIVAEASIAEAESVEAENVEEGAATSDAEPEDAEPEDGGTTTSSANE